MRHCLALDTSPTRTFWQAALALCSGVRSHWLGRCWGTWVASPWRQIESTQQLVSANPTVGTKSAQQPVREHTEQLPRSQLPYLVMLHDCNVQCLQCHTPCLAIPALQLQNNSGEPWASSNKCPANSLRPRIPTTWFSAGDGLSACGSAPFRILSCHSDKLLPCMALCRNTQTWRTPPLLPASHCP